MKYVCVHKKLCFSKTERVLKGTIIEQTDQNEVNFGCLNEMQQQQNSCSIHHIDNW
jgi:hypothetical protein